MYQVMNHLWVNENKLIIGNYAILYDKDGVPFEYNPRKSALHYEMQFDKTYEWDTTLKGEGGATSTNSASKDITQHTIINNQYLVFQNWY